MSQEEPIDLSEKYPELRPVSSSPTLFTLNGVGFGVYGDRDRDPETGAYVKTHCFCVLFVPLIAFSSYLVADAPGGGWYFLGKMPLSGFAKMWNRLLIGGVLLATSGFFWFEYTNSPEYKAEQKLAQADDLQAQQKYAEAANVYLSVAQGSTKFQTTALHKISDLLALLEQQPENEAYPTVVQISVGLARSGLWFEGIPKLMERQQPVIDRLAKVQPTQALAVYDLFEPLAPDQEAFQARRLALLEQIVAAQPENADAVSQLAVVFEEKGDLDRCRELLEPLAGKLSGNDGARILGQIWAREDKQEQARDMLASFVSERMSYMQDAQRAYDSAVENFSTQIIASLNRGDAPQSFYESYDAADEAGKQQLVDEYIRERMRLDENLKTLGKNLGRHQSVVFAALDLGMVQLRLAQDEPDEAKRKKQLEEAEDTFVSIRSFASQEDQFRLYLGQVYYWLGKETEGRALFDELLDSHDRDFDSLMGVAEMLRHLGAAPDARALCEEAYIEADDENQKHQAAGRRAVMGTEMEDRIKWLELADPNDKEVQATLASSKARKLAGEGKLTEANVELSKSIALYDEMPENATTLNNSALRYIERFSLSGNKADLDEGLRRMEQAVKLDAADSILISNAAEVITSAAFAEVIGDEIDLNRLKLSGSQDLIGYLYADEAQRQAILKRLRNSTAILKSQDYLQRSILMAPKSATAYASAAEMYYLLEDWPALEKLNTQFKAAAPNVADQEQQVRDYYLGKNREKSQVEIAAAIEQGRKTLDSLPKKTGPTFAIASGRLARTLMSSGRLGGTCDVDEVVRLAEEAHAAAKSVSTYSLLYDAYLYRACDQLSEQDASFKSLADKYRFAMGEDFLCAFILGEGGELAELLKQHPDTVSTLKAAKERLQATEEMLNVWYWAMLKNTDASLAENLAERIRSDKNQSTSAEIWRGLNSNSASGILQRYWLASINGQRQKGLEEFRAQAAAGVPLPVDLLADETTASLPK